MNLYQEELLDHYQHPRNRGTLPAPTGHAEVKNPLCGDLLSVDVLVRDGKVEEVAFLGEGCVISQAGASMLCELVLGKTVDEIRALGTPEIMQLLGLPPNPTRLKCGLLGLEGLQKALA